jgi:acyl-CoA synthetase (AMP-forming)/AMP-acid ligase II
VEETKRSRFEYSQLRLITIGAARADRATLEQALALFPAVRFAITYGLTEAGPRVSTHFVELGHLDASRVGSPLPNVEICLRTRSDGTQETCVRGHSTMRSYADEVFEEGTDYLLHTADRGELRNGDLYLQGRLDRTINRGGELLSAEAIEEVLLRYPGIAVVRVEAEAHSFWGQVPVARIVFCKDRPLPSLETLHRFCADRLSASEVPARIEFCEVLSQGPCEKTRRMLDFADECFRFDSTESYDGSRFNTVLADQLAEKLRP